MALFKALDRSSLLADVFNNFGAVASIPPSIPRARTPVVKATSYRKPNGFLMFQVGNEPRNSEQERGKTGL